jgi:tetratricopeptide (TPR) repeat protein
MSKKSRARAAAPVAASAKAPTASRTLSPPEPNTFLARWGTLLASGIIVLAALAAYHNSFSGPFIFDDLPAITDNPTIRHLWSAWSPPNDGSGVTGRPVVNFSLAVNYALDGFDVRGYHALNLAIHILAALALFGIVRRTLASRPETRRSEISNLGFEIPEATLLALAVALLWTVHPLQTESVTCVIQRTESLMGLFYLLTLYCFVRGADETGQRQEARGERKEPVARSQEKLSGFRPLASNLWPLASVFFCFLGMASKEVMVSAPLMVLLYDRTFVAGTFREAWKKRGRWHAGLACTWLLLAYLVAGGGGSRGKAAGFGIGISPWTYALTQCKAIILYLKLSVWPHPLIVDYGTGVVHHLVDVLPQALGLVLLVLATILGVWRRLAIGFVGAWFFAILAPSSSVVPLVTQTMAEHRMYLPLAAVIGLVVLGLHRWIGRRSLILFAAIAMGLGWLSIHRNKDYYTEVSIWRDAITKCPGNERAHSNLGVALSKIPGRMPDAIAEYQTALRINPDLVEAHVGLGDALSEIPGRLSDAMVEYQTALRINPDSDEAHSNLGNALSQIPGRLPDAMAEYQAALRINPDYAEAHNNLGNALSQIPGRLPDAIAEYRAALRTNPDYADAHYNLGNALSQIPGRSTDAIAEYQAALRINPDYAEAHYNLALTLAGIPGRLSEAISEYKEALRIKPEYAEAHFSLGNALSTIPGHLPDAISEYEAALRIKPDYVEAHSNLGSVLEEIPGHLQDAIVQYDEAIRLNPEFAEAHYNLGLLLMNIPGRRQDAIFHFEAALRIRPDFIQAQEMLDRLQANQR